MDRPGTSENNSADADLIKRGERILANFIADSFAGTELRYSMGDGVDQRYAHEKCGMSLEDQQNQQDLMLLQ
jgi:hypothetical protein